MKGVIGMRHSRRKESFVAALLAFLLLFAGCAGTESGAKPAPEETETAETETPEGIFLPEEENVLSFETARFTVEGVSEYFSMARDGDGYHLFVFKDGKDVELTLDRDFRLTAEKPGRMSVWGVIDAGGDGKAKYTLEMRQKPNAAEGEESVKMSLCRDGEVLFYDDSCVLTGDAGQASVASEGETVYIVENDMAYLLANGKMSDRPMAEGGCEMIFRGFLRLKDTLFAVLNETNYMTVDNWYLAELHGTRMGEPVRTNVAGWRFTVEADGATCDFVRSDGLYRTDGEKIEKLMDFEKAGVSVVGVRGFWREEGRFVLLLKDGILVLSDKTA